MTRTTISFTRDGMQLIQEAAKRQGSSVSQFVREAALMRAHARSVAHATKLDTARCSVAACWFHSAVGAAATTTALEPGLDTRQAISR